MEVSKQLLKARSGEFDIESIHTLDLSRLDISNLGCLGECTGMQRLDLSFNDITRLYSLASLTALEVLNLSGNRIQSLEGLQALDNLISLNLAGNLLGSADKLMVLTSLEKLQSVRLKDDVNEIANPMCASSSYRQDVLAVLPKITELDGEVLKGPGKDFFLNLRSMEDKLASEETVLKEFSSSDKALVLPTPSLETLSGTLELETKENELHSMLENCQKLSAELDKKLHTSVGSEPET